MNLATLTTSRQAQLMPIPKPQISDNEQIGYSQQHLIDNVEEYRPVNRKRSSASRLIPVLSFSLVLPHWLAQYSLQISVRQAAQNWTLNLKPYRTVPENSELFVAIQFGDFDKSQYLINSGQASVFDQDEHGWTALQV